MLYNSLVLLGILSSAVAGKVSYADHSVLRCQPEDEIQLAKLHELSENNDLELDFWLETRRVNAPIDIMVTKKRIPILNKILSEIGVKCSTMIDDVDKAIERESQLSAGADDSFFNAYHSWTEVQDYIEALAAKYPSLATVSTIGNTYYGKPIKVITMSTKPNTGKPSLWFDGGLHAREWVTISTVTYIADTLVTGYGTNSNSTYLLDTYDIVIAPILNVDGYDYTWTDDRMWRKTRSPNTPNPCVGTDPNRNWEFHWGEAGTSTNKCSESYQGPYAASEVEVQAIQNYLYDNRATLKAYVNFHSYSQLWMSPWGYTAQLPEDYTTQNDLSKLATDAIYSVHGKTYDYGPIATTIYPASGSSADYAYGVCGIVYSYGVELRDTGEFGFLLPPAEIIPSGQEIFAAVLAMGEYIEKTL